MRLTLVLLSNLRALLVTRAVFLGFVLAVLCAATTAHGLQSRAHHKSTASTRRTASHSHSTSRTRASAVAHRRAIRRRPAVVRARMPIRRYRWMKTPTPAARSANASAPHTSVAVAEDSDPSETNAATPQDAANQIAAAEVPAGPQAELHAVGPDPFLSKNIVKMAPLRGSLESLIRQNEKTNADNLERIEDDTDLQSRITNGQLVRVPESSGLAVNPSLPDDRRYCRPWTATFLKDLSKAHESQFHRSFEVSSAVRTVQYQKHLMRTNGNAAPAEGDVASPHLTGATIDIAKRGLTRSELYWMRNRLQALQDQGKIDVEEEFRQSCFHITVYKSYVGAGPARKPNPHTLQTPDEDSPAAPADQPVHPA